MLLITIANMLLNSCAVMVNCIFNRLHQSRVRIRIAIRVAVMITAMVRIRVINGVIVMKDIAMVE